MKPLTLRFSGLPRYRRRNPRTVTQCDLFTGPAPSFLAQHVTHVSVGDARPVPTQAFLERVKHMTPDDAYDLWRDETR